MAQAAARIFLMLVKIAYPGMNPEIIARGILVDEASKVQDFSPIDILFKKS
jgi:hypothetical protein